MFRILTQSAILCERFFIKEKKKGASSGSRIAEFLLFFVDALVFGEPWV